MNSVLAGDTIKNQSKKKRYIKQQEKQAQKDSQRTVEITKTFNPDCVFRPSQDMFKGETPYIALDCEMVETDGRNDALAR